MKRFMRWSVAAALVMGLSLAGMPSSQAAGDPKVLSMLVMGDSYSAGNGAGAQYGPAGCWRSAYNYAREYERIVEKAPYSQRGFVENVACSGDTTSAISNWTNGRPPQINAVNTGYDIVFLTLGGNDIYFGDIVYHCLIRRTRTGGHCDENLTRAEGLLRDGSLKQRLTTSLQSIRSRTAPQTKIVLLGYPTLERDPNYWLANGNSKVMVGGRVRAIGDLGESIQRQVVDELNAGTSEQPFVFVSVKGLFAGPPSHELSAQSNNPNRWMVQPSLDASWASLATYYHPNPTGWSQEARLLANDGRVPKHPQPVSSSGGSGGSQGGTTPGRNPGGSASGGTGRILISPCLNMRAQASGSSALIGCIPKDTVITIDCVANGNAVTGPYGSTTLWDHTSYAGKSGFVSDAWVYTGKASAVAGSCGSTPSPAPQGGSASGGTGRILISPCLNMRAQASGSSALIGCIPKDTVITIDCVANGNAVTGPYGSTTLWDHTSYAGKSGFVSDAWVYTGKAGAVAGSC